MQDPECSRIIYGLIWCRAALKVVTVVGHSDKLDRTTDTIKTAATFSAAIECQILDEKKKHSCFMVRLTIQVLDMSTCKPLPVDLGSERQQPHIQMLFSGWKKVGVAKTFTKLNSDLAKYDYLEWVCIRFVCKYNINH